MCTYVCVPTYVYLHMCTYICVPTYVYLHMCTYYLYLPMCTYYLYLPMCTYERKPHSWLLTYLGLLIKGPISNLHYNSRSFCRTTSTKTLKNDVTKSPFLSFNTLRCIERLFYESNLKRSLRDSFMNQI